MTELRQDNLDLEVEFRDDKTPCKMYNLQIIITDGREKKSLFPMNHPLHLRMNYRGVNSIVGNNTKEKSQSEYVTFGGIEFSTVSNRNVLNEMF